MDKITIITPVGPGHTKYPRTPGHVYIEDFKGELGRSKARNMGMEQNPDADWYFFLDADDELAPNAVEKMHKAIEENPEALAIFGKIRGHDSTGATGRSYNHYPKTWDEVVNLETQGTFCISALWHAKEARELGFHEALNITETLEFTMAFICMHPWVKLNAWFTNIRGDRPSATGPRGYEKLSWHTALQPLMAYWKKRGQIPLTPEEREPFNYWA